MPKIFRSSSLADEAELMLPEMAKNLAISTSVWRVEWVKQS